MLSRQVLENIASIEQMDKGTAMHAYKRIFIDKGAHCPCYNFIRAAKQVRKLEILVNWAHMVSLSLFRGITKSIEKYQNPTKVAFANWSCALLIFTFYEMNMLALLL